MNESLPQSMPPEHCGPDAVAAWWVRRRKTGLSASERRDLRAWLAADAHHRRAFRAADPTANDLDWPLHVGALDEVLVGLEQRARLRRQRRGILSAVAALGCVAIMWIALSSRTQRPIATPSAPIFGPGTQRLSDGSLVELRAGTEVRAAFTDAVRHLDLVRGEAHFQVTKNPARPFIVRVGQIDVRAVGTAFSVKCEEASVAVLVTEGQVAVEERGGSAVHDLAQLTVGQHLVLDRPARSTGANVRTLSADEMWSQLEWRVPLLEFAGTPLREVIARMNAHAKAQGRSEVVSAEPALHALRVSGVLRADKVDALIALLEAEFGVVAEHRADGSVLLRPGSR